MLTDRQVRALKSRPAMYRVADGKGLCLEVTPSGGKHWRYRYRFDGKPTMLSLGTWDHVTLEQARVKRSKAETLLKAGSDPAAVARAQRVARVERNGNTFGAIADELLGQRSKKLSGGSLLRERRMIEKDLAPLADVPIADVTAPMLLSALRKVEARGAVETAHRVRSLAGMVFRYGIATGRAERNVAADLAGALESPIKRHFAAVIDPVKVAELLRALHRYQGTPPVEAALKLAPMVFVRPGELRQARWADIDLDAAEWRFKASKTGQPHIVPLASQAVAILRDLRPLTGRSVYVFPSIRDNNRPMSENTVNVALRALGYGSESMTGHGFRALARTILDEYLGFRPDFIEHQLAHAVRDPNGRAYNRTAHLAERQKMMASWADYLDGLREGSNIVAFRKIG